MKNGDCTAATPRRPRHCPVADSLVWWSRSLSKDYVPIRGKCFILPIALALVLLVVAPLCDASPDEDRLLEGLLGSYNRLSRPAKKESDKVEVIHGTKIKKIKDFNSQTYLTTFELLEIIEWKDYRLKWSERVYGNIKSVRLPSEMVWLPDLKPYEGWYDRSDLTNKVVVKSDGTVKWIVQRLFSTMCGIDGPTVYCSMDIGSWTYDATEMNLTTKEKLATDKEIDTFQQNFNKFIVNVRRWEKNCPDIGYNCPKPHVTLAYSLKFDKAH